MTIERMSEQQKDKVRHNPEGEGSQESSDEFVASGIEEYGKAIARYSLLDREPSSKLGKTDTEIAKSLVSIKIDDPNLEKRVSGILKAPKISVDDASLLTTVFEGKAAVKESEGFLTPVEKNNLSKFVNTVVDDVLDKIGKTKGKAIRTASMIGLLATACSAKITPPALEISPTNVPVPTEVVPSPTETPRAKEMQIAPSPTREMMENILLTSVNVMTKEEIETNPLLFDSNFQEGINNYIHETREIRELTEENTVFELVVIKGIKENGDEMFFPFAAWTAQNREGLTFVDMIGVSESGLVMITLEHQEIEVDGVIYYALVLQDIGPIFAIPASEIDNPDANVSFSPSGKAIEETEMKIGAKVLFALRSEIETPEVKVSDVTEDDRLFVDTTVMGERKLLPLGLSEHFRISAGEGLKSYFLSGVLLEAPYYDGNAFVIFKLGIPDSSQDKFREFYYKSPVVVSREGEIVCNLQYNIKNVTGGFDLFGGAYKGFSLEEELELYEKSVGRQIVFWLNIGPTEESELEHLKNYLEQYGDWISPRTSALKILIDEAHENYQVFTYLLNGNPAYENREFGMLTDKEYVPWSSADWK